MSAAHKRTLFESILWWRFQYARALNRFVVRYGLISVIAVALLVALLIISFILPPR